MRMNVVLPLPFGPRKPQISPVLTWRSTLIDGDEIAEALGHSRYVDGKVIAHGLGSDPDIDRLAGVEARGRLGIEDRLDHEYELCTVLPAIDDGRSIFRLR